MKLTAHNLVKAYQREGGKGAWDKLTLASTIGGMVINTAGVTLAHGMEHPVKRTERHCSRTGTGSAYSGSDRGFAERKSF